LIDDLHGRVVFVIRIAPPTVLADGGGVEEAGHCGLAVDESCGRSAVLRRSFLDPVTHGEDRDRQVEEMVGRSDQIAAI
jgi:hypothetical protein